MPVPSALNVAGRAFQQSLPKLKAVTNKPSRSYSLGIHRHEPELVHHETLANAYQINLIDAVHEIGCSQASNDDQHQIAAQKLLCCYQDHRLVFVQFADDISNLKYRAT